MTRRRKPNFQSGSFTTADRLARAVYDDLLPEDPKTCEDYGFNRAITVEEQCNLLGLYIGTVRNLVKAIFLDMHDTRLIKIIGIPSKTVHNWCVRGALVDEIKSAFYMIPEGSRGTYFPWFLQNQHIVALAGQPLSAKEMRDHGDGMLVRTWRFTGGSERDSPKDIRAAVARQPPEEQQCYSLYALLLSRSTPSTDLPNLWVDFGFTSCTSQEEEDVLGGQYQRLIALCTFKEFCDAYRDRRLLKLFCSKGLCNDKLRDLLPGPLPTDGKESVWDLKGFVLQEGCTGEETSIPSSVTVDYGFINCMNASERQQLKKVYKYYFDNPHGDPLALHEAAMKGSLYDFLSNKVQGLHGPEFQRLLKNQHPYLNLVLSRKPWFSAWQAPSFILNTKALVFVAGLCGVLLVMFSMRVLSL